MKMIEEEMLIMDETKNPVQSAGKIFQILETLSETGPIGLIELSNALGLHKSTAFRLLNSLIYMGYVVQEKETSKYMLSFKILEVAGKLLDKMDIVSIVHPYIVKLAEQSKETVHLVQRSGNNTVYIDKVESEANSIRMVSKIGTTIPMYCSGVGKAILAALPKDKVEAVWNSSEIIKKTPYTITNINELYRILDEVREKGYALDNEENEAGVRCIAACIIDNKGKPANAFSISAPVSRMTEERVEELSHYVLEMKEKITKELRYFR